jgi:cell fate (sporulation/competence/biofilm development) regulator YlbF (YheA/YmcA/DUF963 family)
MDFRDAYEFAHELRKLLRRANRFGYDLETLKDEIEYMAEAKENYAAYEEARAVIEMAKNALEVT